ncbi:hypothetical protein CKQ84_12515 [Shewanella sp. WE21]|jgi:hypothetical protein|nr:hypothetical protein CKQ84_12515 [Shewanella sp. WE21]
MVMGETTVRPMDGAVEHPRTDSLRVGERMQWRAAAGEYQQTLSTQPSLPLGCNPTTLTLRKVSTPM